MSYFLVRPWDKGIHRNIIFPHLPGIEGKTASPDRIWDAATLRINEVNARYNIYTDGSASAGVSEGGAGVVVTTGDSITPTVLTTLQEKGAKITCSYEEEKRALEMALDWIQKNLKDAETAAIYTDSQSICTALLSQTPYLDELRVRINATMALIAVQWIPGHSKIPGNELADTTAKLATARPGTSRRIAYGSICSHIKVLTKDKPHNHERTLLVYSALSQDREKRVKTRSDQSLLARLRSGHFLGLRAYKHRIDPTSSPICNLCEEEEQDLEHWLLRCPALAAQRRNLFGPDDGRLDNLTRHPNEVVALARSSLLGAQ